MFPVSNGSNLHPHNLDILLQRHLVKQFLSSSAIIPGLTPPDLHPLELLQPLAGSPADEVVAEAGGRVAVRGEARPVAVDVVRLGALQQIVGGGVLAPGWNKNKHVNSVQF